MFTKKLFSKYSAKLLNEIELWESMAPYTSDQAKAEKISEVTRVDILTVEQAMNDYALSR